MGVDTIEAFSSASFRRLPVRQFRARLCDSGQTFLRVEAQCLNDLTPPLVLFNPSVLYCSLHSFRASQRDMLNFSEESRVFDNAAIGVGGEAIKAHVNANRRFGFNRGLWQIGKIELGDQGDIPFARRIALECRALERQVNRLRLSNLDPSDFRNMDAASIEFDPLRRPLKKSPSGTTYRDLT